MFKFKSLAAAAALVLAAPAFAAISLPTGNGDNTELFLVVQDSAAKVSFTLDLGLTLGDFNAAPIAPHTWSLAGNANWATFSSVANLASASWAVMALDNTGGITANGQRLLTTVRDGQSPAKLTNAQLVQGIGSTQGLRFIVSTNSSGTHATQDNGSSVNYEPETGYAYFGEAGGLTPNLNGNSLSFQTTNAIGVDAGLFLLSRSSTSNGAFVSVLEQTTVSFEGGVLQISAVPEPSTYALMLGGLLAVGALARRRRG